MSSVGVLRAVAVFSLLAGGTRVFAQSDMRGHWSGAVDTPNGLTW